MTCPVCGGKTVVVAAAAGCGEAGHVGKFGIYTLHPVTAFANVAQSLEFVDYGHGKSSC